MERDEAIKHLCALHDSLEQERILGDSYQQELHEYTLPAKAAITSDFDASATPYREKYDAMGMLGAARFAANMYTHATPPQGRWFLLSPAAGSKLERDRTYADNLGDRTERLHYALQQSNFETEIQGCYEDLAAGTCCLAAQRDDQSAFTLSTRPRSEYCFLENHKSRIDTVFVRRNWTAYEAAQRFGLGKIAETLRESLTKQQPAAFSQRRTYLNAIRPNEEWNPRSVTAARFPFTSLWIDKETKGLLEMRGVKRLRYIIARFWRPTGMAWGMGPSDMAYSWIRCKDKAVEILLKYAARVMDPPSVWPDDGAFHPASTLPGTKIKGRMSAIGGGMPQYLQIQGNHQIAQWLIEYLDGVILQAYFADIFRVLTDNKERTASEVATVLQKDFTMAIPVVGRLKAELFGPLLRLCLELLTEYELGIHGWLYGGKPLPEYEYDLELISPLGLAVKYAELQKMSDLVLLNSQLANVDPRVWDNYSLDDMSHGIGDSMGVPRHWLRSITERRAIRERAQALQEQQIAMQQANVGSDIVQKLGKDVGPRSPMALAAA